jgi:hypothetical protein
MTADSVRDYPSDNNRQGGAAWSLTTVNNHARKLAYEVRASLRTFCGMRAQIAITCVIWRDEHEVGEDHRCCCHDGLGSVGIASAQSGPVAKNCQADISKLCADKTHDGSIHICLETNYDQASAACKSALDNSGGGRGKALGKGLGKGKAS